MITFGIYMLSIVEIFCLGRCRAFLSTESSIIRGSFSNNLRCGRAWNLVYLNKRRSAILSLYEENKEDEDDDMTISSKSQLALPALGPAGTSSNIASSEKASSDDFADSTIEMTSTATNDDGGHQNQDSAASFVNPKFALQYTCKVCNTKNRVIVSRQAYREGMVIVVCKGCNNKHWIADNLDPTLAHNNIEEYFESCGKADTVNRVNEEVYEIERVWGLKEGEITGESGNAVLE